MSAKMGTEQKVQKCKQQHIGRERKIVQGDNPSGFYWSWTYWMQDTQQLMKIIGKGNSPLPPNPIERVMTNVGEVAKRTDCPEVFGDRIMKCGVKKKNKLSLWGGWGFQFALLWNFSCGSTYLQASLFFLVRECNFMAMVLVVPSVL